MTDHLGNSLAVGDKVVFGLAQTLQLATGEIVKINQKTVKIRYTGYDDWGRHADGLECLRTFDNVVRV